MSTGPWNLFLDDEREPTWELYQPEIARSFDEAVELVRQFGVPDVISFDYDLGRDVPTGKDFLGWLVEEHLDGRLDLNTVKRVIVHSANPVGARNIELLWNGFASSELDFELKAELRPRTSNFK